MLDDIARHGKRFLLSFPLKVRMHEPGSWNASLQEDPAQEESTIAENISSRGCYFHLSREVPVGTSLELEITIPGAKGGGTEERIGCRGRVVRVDPPASDGRVGVATTIDSYHFGKTSKEAGHRKAAYVQ